MGRRTPDIIGQQFKDWLVVERLPNLDDGSVIYNCICKCGNHATKRGHALRHGSVEKNCGCDKLPRVVVNVKHGFARSKGLADPRYSIWRSAMRRAELRDVPFDLEITDIVIPEFCPVLGIRLQHNSKPNQDSSPSLDALVPGRGYVKGNVSIISMRANRIKNNATATELRRIADWMDGKD